MYYKFKVFQIGEILYENHGYLFVSMINNYRTDGFLKSVS